MAASLGRASQRIDRESALDLLERGADARVVIVGETSVVEVPQAPQAVAYRKRHIAEVGRLARDAELELRRPVAVTADEHWPLHAVIEHARWVRVGADVFGTAPWTAVEGHRARFSTLSHEIAGR